MTASAWIEGLSKELGLDHNHHKFCGHGGEIYVDYIEQHGNKKSTKVDGYEPTTETVFEFSGCYLLVITIVKMSLMKKRY